LDGIQLVCGGGAVGDQGLRQYLWPLVFSRELGHWFFRVKKQEGVDRNLTSIESRVEALVSKLEKHAQDFLGYTTGADSFAYFTPMLPGADIVELGLTNKSSYPVFDVRAEVIDLDEAIDPDKGKFWTRHQFLLASLYPSRILLGAYRFDLTGRQRLHLNIFIQSRSQSGSQQLRIARMGGEIRIAIKTTVGDKVVERSIPVDYPGNDPNDPDAIFK
jgi:hypothetical protein